MTKFFSSVSIRSIISALLFIILIGNSYGQDDKPTETPAQNTPNPETPKETTSGTSGDAIVNESLPKAETTQEAPRIFINQGIQKAVNEQYRWTPEDPSFLYETRNIPDRKTKEEFLPTELEKVIVKERIQEERDFRKSLQKIKIRLPDLTQTLVLVSIIIILLVYRSRARKSQDQRR